MAFVISVWMEYLPRTSVLLLMRRFAAESEVCLSDWSWTADLLWKA
jgi:hypothetical protein